MSDLLFWFLVSQTLAGLPQLPAGTEVLLVSRDLVTIIGRARVEEGRLEFASPMAAGQELRLLIVPPNASDQERAQAIAGVQALPARVADDGLDILVELPELEGPISLKKWLEEERDIVLVMPVSGPNRRAP
jgi:hypothetical protein